MDAVRVEMYFGARFFAGIYGMVFVHCFSRRLVASSRENLPIAGERLRHESTSHVWNRPVQKASEGKGIGARKHEVFVAFICIGRDSPSPSRPIVRRAAGLN